MTSRWAKGSDNSSIADPWTVPRGVPLGARFAFTIRDNGDGELTFSASYGSQTATKNAPVAAAFRGATVRFQTGAYQQSSAEQGAAADDGARVTFYALSG